MERIGEERKWHKFKDEPMTKLLRAIAKIERELGELKALVTAAMKPRPKSVPRRKSYRKPVYLSPR